MGAGSLLWCKNDDSGSWAPWLLLIISVFPSFHKPHSANYTIPEQCLQQDVGAQHQCLNRASFTRLYACLV
jgi:hypothetical protein